MAVKESSVGRRMRRKKLGLEWKYKKVDKFRDLWQKGEDKKFPAKTKDWIMLDKTPGAIQKYTDDNYSVAAKRKINPQTINGHYRFYKTRAAALKFVKKYLSKY